MSKYVSNAKADAATKEVLARVDYDRWMAGAANAKDVDWSGAAAESPKDQEARLSRELPLAANAHVFDSRGTSYTVTMPKPYKKKWSQWWG